MAYAYLTRNSYSVRPVLLQRVCESSGSHIMNNYFAYVPLILSFYCAFTVFAGTIFSNKQYDSCLTPERESGQCIVITYCPSLLNLLKNRPITIKNEERLKLANCGYEGVHPKVCCSLTETDAIYTTSKTGRSYQGVPVSSLVNNLLPNLNECGPVLQDRLILGHRTTLGYFPWTILLEYEKPNDRGVHCGGSLINNRYVLTAAHCVSQDNISENWNLIGVHAGEFDRNTDPDCEGFDYCAAPVSKIPIEENIVHEYYDPSSLNGYHDIALLRLAHDVQFVDSNVQPICLQPSSEFIKNISGVGEVGTVTGWGITNQVSEINEKYQSQMQIKDNDECESKYADRGLRIGKNQFCASGKNACYGDSGGIFFYINHSKQYENMNAFAYGLQSIGLPLCSLQESPVVYTKIESYIPWINSKLKP